MERRCFKWKTSHSCLNKTRAARLLFYVKKQLHQIASKIETLLEKPSKKEFDYTNYMIKNLHGEKRKTEYPRDSIKKKMYWEKEKGNPRSLHTKNIIDSEIERYDKEIKKYKDI